MSDTLVGVVIGGIIASVAPLITLLHSERRWRFELKLNHLKAERERFEKLYEENLELFENGIAENSYSSIMSANMFVLMPNEVREIFNNWVEDKEKSSIRKKHVYLEIAAAMKRDIARRDAEIRYLLDK